MTPGELFDQNQRLAYFLAHLYSRRFKKLTLDDLCQEALIALFAAAQRYDESRGAPFGAFAARKIRWALADLGRAARARTVSLDQPLAGAEDGDAYTFADRVCDDFAAREERTAIPAEREAALLAKLPRLVTTLPELTPAQRRVLRLRFLDGLELEEIRRRLGLSRMGVYVATRGGLEKLRAHLRERGVL